MKSLPRLVAFLITTASLVFADGIPVDRKTGKVNSPHSVVSLTDEQVEETQTLGTITLTPEQWRDIRQKSPQCPKRFGNLIPVTWNDCLCGVEGEYVIALSRDRIAVLHRTRMWTLRYELALSSSIMLRMNERGEFFLGGRLIPFPMLLEALVTPPDGAGGKKGRHLDVELPVGSKQTDAVFESRLREVAAAADKMGISHMLFSQLHN